MNIYPYPDFRKKVIIDKTVTHLLYLISVILFYQKYSFFMWFISTQWSIYIIGEIKDYWQKNQGWIAKLDNECLYLFKPKNKIPIIDIGKIERQTIHGKKVGINIISKSGHVRSEQFPMLNEQQMDELVQFLNRSLATK